MIIIRVMETGNDIRCLYRQATTPNQRALLGYMVRKGRTDDTILGGALHLLREIERAERKGSVYHLSLETPYAKRIIEWVELAQFGALDRFALSPFEVQKCIRLMNL